jgi:thymidylate synthase
MSIADKYFKAEITDILENGFSDKNYKVRPVWVNDDGTTEPAHTIKKFGVLRSYDLAKEFPILTLRTQPFKTAVKEVIWMWCKKSNVVADLGAKIWDSWMLEDGTIGKTYSYQLAQKYDLPEGYMDQVEALIYNLKNNPMNRRMIVTMWNPRDLKEMNKTLMPCVYETIWDVTDGRLNCTLVQRSGDVAAAASSGGFDTIEYALLVHMIAQVCGLKPGILNHYVNNLHIYDRHVEIMKEVLNNPEYEAPTLWINPDVKNLEDFTIDDFKLIDYKSTKYNGKIPVAV